jgi:hypothetical protein
MRKLSASLAVSLIVFSGIMAAQKKSGSSDAKYIAQALSAAPKSVAKDAAVIRMENDGKVTTLRQGKNGFSCMVVGGDIALSGESMCADANSLAFFDAWMKHENPPEKLGITYMLGGDKGASNTDPFAKGKTADNHWVVTGPHIMVLGPEAKSLGLSSNADADPSTPYMMWAGTPYEHAMIPVASGAAMKRAGAKADEMKK